MGVAATKSAPISTNLSLSRYRVIEAVLREQIVSGEYAPGDRLPAEAELCEIFGASRPTVRQALGALEADNLVSRQHGRGTFVKAPQGGPLPDRLQLSFEEMIEPPKPLQISIQRVGLIRGQGIVHRMLKLPQGTEIFYFIRIYMLGRSAIGGAKVHIPNAMRDRIDDSDMVARNVPKMIARRAGKRLGACEFSFDSTLAEPRYAEIVGTRAGAPLTSIRRTSFADDGEPLEHTHLLLRPDKCFLVGQRTFSRQEREEDGV